jgi:hypothetical protein
MTATQQRTVCAVGAAWCLMVKGLFAFSEQSWVVVLNEGGGAD